MNNHTSFDDPVLRDLGDLATHVRACRLSRGSRHWLLAQLELAHALVAPGFQSAGDVSLHLQAADVALQPYPDGADTRRTSLMACLANGVLTITTRGRFTDAAWRDAPIVMGPPDQPLGAASLAADLARDPFEREARRRAVRDFYRARFAVDRTVERLLAGEGGG